MTDQDQQSSDNPEAQTDARRIDLGEAVIALVNAVTKGIEEELEPHNLGAVEFSLLSFCYENEECTATELAGALPVDAPGVSRMVTKLAERGLLRRRRLRSDRRVVMLRLSDDGMELTSLLRQNIRDFYARISRDISSQDMRMFASIVDRIAGNYAAMKSGE